MGSFNYKGNNSTYHSISDNIPSMKESYTYNNGYFGKIGKSRVADIRQIDCSDPIRESKKFYDKLANGGIEEILPNGKGVMTSMKDGTVITYRVITSTEGSPAVDINIKRSSDTRGIKKQKIHFEKENK